MHFVLGVDVGTDRKFRGACNCETVKVRDDASQVISRILCDCQLMLVKERHAQVSEYVRSEAWKSTAVLPDPPLSQATKHQRRRSMTRLCSTGMSAEQHRVRNDGNTLGGITLLLSSCGQNLNLCSSCLPLLSAIGFAWLRWWKERWSAQQWIAALAFARAGQQRSKQRLVNHVVLTVVEVQRLTAESVQHRQYTKAMNLKLLPM